LATGPATTISFWAPETVIGDWSAVIEGVQARFGPLPTWAAAIFVLQIAVREWERVDPARRPAEWKVLQRDRWRCQTPGCSSRRKLEVHHIIFRSRGGGDHPENLTTLCHGHHQHGIHREGLNLEGTAPNRLKWKLGGNKWFMGSKRISGRGNSMTIP
jgi:HNH endonuclease